MKVTPSFIINNIYNTKINTKIYKLKYRYKLHIKNKKKIYLNFKSNLYIPINKSNKVLYIYILNINKYHAHKSKDETNPINMLYARPMPTCRKHSSSFLS